MQEQEVGNPQIRGEPASCSFFLPNGKKVFISYINFFFNIYLFIELAIQIKNIPSGS